jgi:hypothetical protein
MADGATQLVRRLAAHDLEFVFGVCGDTPTGPGRTRAEEQYR